MPTTNNDIPYLVSALPIKGSDVVYDLGSGNGCVVFGIERACGARVAGGEMILILHLLSRLKRWWYGSKAEFFLGDFYRVSVKDATVIYVYLLPKLLPALFEKVQTECQPGTIIVSRDFYAEGRTPERELQTLTGHKFLIYTV